MPPLIDYECKACGSVKETLIPRPVPDEIQCPHCGNMMARLINGFGDHQIKGNNSASTKSRRVK